MTDPDISQIGALNRQPANVNQLITNNFKFSIHRLPNTEYKITSINIPGMSIPVVKHKNPFNPLPMQGSNIRYGNLELIFQLDEDMKNYIELHSWIRGSALPVSNKEYSELRELDTDMSPFGGLYSDAVLTIGNNESIPNINVFFHDIFPIDLSDIVFRSTGDADFISVGATFAYAYFDIEPVIR